MKKIKIEIDLFNLSLIHSEIESAYNLGLFNMNSIFYVYAIFDLYKKLSKKLTGIFSKEDNKKVFKITLKLNEFEALYKFLNESNQTSELNELLIFFGYLNEIKVNYDNFN
jgi:hypothetical protein